MDVTQVLESTLSPGMFFYFIFYIILFFLSFSLFLAIFLIYSCIVTLADRMFSPSFSRCDDTFQRRTAAPPRFPGRLCMFFCFSLLS